MAQSDAEFFLSGLSFTEANCIEFTADGLPDLSGDDVRAKRARKEPLKPDTGPGPLRPVENCDLSNAV